MAIMSLRKKQSSELKAKYDKSTNTVTFFFAGEKIAARTIPECKEIYPQYVWDQVKEKVNEYIIFTL